MTQALPSSVKPDRMFRLRTAIGAPFGLWSQVRHESAELSWVLAGKFGLMAANALVMLFLANRLSLAAYGLLVITISGQLLISRFLIVGVDTGMVRLTAVPDLRARRQEVETAGLVLMMGTSSVLLVSLLALPMLSQLGVSSWVIASMVAGSIGTALVDYGYSFRLARRQFPLASLAQGGTAIWRLGLTVAAALLIVHPVAVFLAYHGASLLSGLAQTILIARTSWQRPDISMLKRLLVYSFWKGKANIIIIFSLYQGTFLLMLLNQPAATGIFGLGLTLSLGFFAIYNAYSEYLLVRISAVADLKDIPRFMTRALAAALVLMIACVPLVYVVAKLMPWYLGREWLVVVPIFVYLSASMVLLILQAPLEVACHYLLKPQLITLGWVMRAILIGVAGFLLAQQMGALGVAIGQLVGSVLALVFLSWIVVGSLRTARAS